MRKACVSADRTAADPLPFLVIGLGRLLERQLKQGLANHGVTAGQLMVVTSIASTARSSRGDLARRLQITPQAVGGITAQLVTKGLISRTPAPPGLPVDFALTEAGLDLLEEALPVVDALAQGHAQVLQAQPRHNLAGALDGALRHIMINFSGSTG